MTTSPRKVTILGAGAIAYGTAAVLCRDGHDVMLWSPSGERTKGLAAGEPLSVTGAITAQFHPRVADSCAQAVTSAEIVVVAVPGYGHRNVLAAAALHLRNDQTVIFSSHMSLAALYLSNLLRLRGISTPIAALGTTVLTARQPSPNSVRIGSIRARMDMTVLPEGAATHGMNVCRSLFGDRFVFRPNILAVSLSNVNPEVHLAIILCNIARVENGEDWTQFFNVTPAVAKFLEALDAERLAIAQHLGLTVRTIHDHFHLSYNLPYGPLAEMVKPLGHPSRDVKGPSSLTARYVTEDVPYGLVPTVRLAALAGIPAPLHESGVRLMSALLNQDLEAQNDILPELGSLSMASLTGSASPRGLGVKL
ncbi:hypothetical protein N7492_002161 [Penicillium capsulatum]|uniref:2-dehydropantoate 2-reductase n=1 Tax=Penicillium capsulatum TaxID=69766 RepID=A0A9W9INJ9_9EURO|nr:hypothetical protein N7492_002161 [Penicillium capsulatum]KAJ6123229.1 hypothetical protein N7512_005694 [Penicillium capsulatum]